MALTWKLFSSVGVVALVTALRSGREASNNMTWPRTPRYVTFRLPSPLSKSWFTFRREESHPT